MRRQSKIPCFLMVLALSSFCGGEERAPRLDEEILPLLKAHCVKCHGPAKQEGGLNLSTPAGMVRGDSEGPVIAPHDIEASRLWERVERDAMPPDEPLTADQKSLLRQWILAGAPGLSSGLMESPKEEHWAFRTIQWPAPPPVRIAAGLRNPIDFFIQSARESHSVDANPEAEPSVLIRRVSLDLTGLPPTPDELQDFLRDTSVDAYARMIDDYLASPGYGVRWGKYWLDATGYADSNGYFNADTDRPLAYRYRDYVVRSLNADKPFDQFVREQIAGDLLADYQPGQMATPETVELLEATHFLRNGQDGTGESDGNPDEVRADRYYALESAMQNTSTSLLGLTIQCAKCHDHKFEPISQEDYYRWQAVFYPTFHIEKWVKPQDRAIYAPLPAEQLLWEQQTREMAQRVDELRSGLSEWLAAHRVRGDVLFEASFDSSSSRLEDHWSAMAPGDDGPGGDSPVALDENSSPAAILQNGQLQIIAGKASGDSWISTRQGFDWTPDAVGAAIQVTFDLVDDQLASDAKPAQRIGYFIALHDFDDNSQTQDGNLLIDGNPESGSTLYLDYPGNDSRSIGVLGATGYTPGHNYGIRVTNLGEDKFRLEHLVDGFPEDKPIDVVQAALPDGGFGFEYCCGRSFIVDNVVVERMAATQADSPLSGESKKRQEELREMTRQQKQLANNRPGKIAWAGDMSGESPNVHLLIRGNYSSPGQVVQPGTFSVLNDAPSPFAPGEPGSRALEPPRLAWANWVTQTDSRAAALMARVQVNRVWQHHFGTGIVSTSENLGISGAAPTHPELLEWLAAEFIRSGWSLKWLHRTILNSATYRQSSGFVSTSYEKDPDNRLLWRYPARRLDAEAIRDSMLAMSGELDSQMGGPYVATSRIDTGEVIAPEGSSGSRRRAIYLYQRRTQIVSFLSIFDAPSIVFTSVRRNTSTIPLQSLSLLNSDFVVGRAERTAAYLQESEHDVELRLAMTFRRIYSREPSAEELSELIQFLKMQVIHYAGDSSPNQRAWADLCQALLASSEFLYIE